MPRSYIRVSIMPLSRDVGRRCVVYTCATVEELLDAASVVVNNAGLVLRREIIAIKHENNGGWVVLHAGRGRERRFESAPSDWLAGGAAAARLADASCRPAARSPTGTFLPRLADGDR